MSNKNFPVLSFLFSALIFISCRKDIDTAIPPPVIYPGFSIPAASPVTGKITGIVVDENNNPVQNADVALSGNTYQTDTKGFFQINNTQLDKYVTTVTVMKAGYFKAFRSFSATASTNYISIKLIPKTLSGTVDANTGGIVNLPNGTSISLPQNGMIVKSSGAAYAGAIKVYASYIDPTSSDFAARVPGSMMGKDTSKMYVLQSTGMIAVDLETAGGQSLQLATGKTAAIKMPIPSSLIGKAPATINTWSLDDRGIWVKEGTATKNGDHYDMQVTHFSFWNCDVPANAVYLTIHVKDQNNNPLPNAWVQLTIPNNNTWWATTHGITNSNGFVSGLVPANLGLVMNISTNIYSCTTPFATQNIGPFSRDTTINISVTVNTTQLITVNGTFNNCNGQPVQSGLASILFGSYNYYTTPVVNGSYSITVPFCTASSTATVWLVDSTTGAAANPVTVAISGNPVIVPTQTACIIQQPATYFLNGCTMFGKYTVGVPVDSADYLRVIVDVQTVGQYNIITNQVNGLQFSDTGTFSVPGRDTLYLRAYGNPINPGNFSINTAGGQSCGVLLFVGTNAVQAVYNFGPNNACTGSVVSGNYLVNIPLNQTNTVSFTVNVITPGAYLISTRIQPNGTTNGMVFSDTGVFNNTGPVTVTLKGSGWPSIAGTTALQPIGNGVAYCMFDIVSTNAPATAVYTFEGAPGNCAGATIAGTYLTGIPLIGQNTVALQVNVTTTGTYIISTNNNNGFAFSGQGTFSTTGLRTVLLTAAGTPLAPAVTTFIANAGSAQGCAFNVISN